MAAQAVKIFKEANKVDHEENNFNSAEAFLTLHHWLNKIRINVKDQCQDWATPESQQTAAG